MSDLSPARTGSNSRVHRSVIKCNRVSIYLSNAELDAVIQKLQLPMGMHPFSVGRAVADHFRRSEMHQRPATSDQRQFLRLKSIDSHGRR